MKYYQARQKLFTVIERKRKSKVIAYITGDRAGLSTQISPEIIDIFVDHLDVIGPTKKISLILYTNGGDTAAAWRLVNLLQIFCDELEVIVIAKALSAGTLISLGANKIVMTKQAALGPIDPSLNHVLNPVPPSMPHVGRVPVSVEAVKGYLDAAADYGINGETQRAQIFIDLASKVHPLVLGQIFRTSSQIRLLAKKLLSRQVVDAGKAEKIIDFLCAESGSHDHTINRREAKELGLNIETPSIDFYATLKELHASYVQELRLLEPYDPNIILGASNSAEYTLPRAIIETKKSGCHQFISEGTLTKNINETGVVTGISDARRFEGWRKLS
jgi:ClpP class serine protease